MLVAEVEEEEEVASRQLVVGISAIRVHVAVVAPPCVLWWARGQPIITDQR